MVDADGKPVGRVSGSGHRSRAKGEFDRKRFARFTRRAHNPGAFRFATGDVHAPVAVAVRDRRALRFRLHLGAHGARRQRGEGGHAAPAGCEKRGEVEVSVKDRLGPYERNSLRVHEELETLARNEAPGLNADTVQPLAAPGDGAQRYAAWRCGR